MLKFERDFPVHFPGSKELQNSKFKIYSKLSEYIEDFTIVGNVKFENIKFLFELYFGVLFVILIVFLFDFFYRFLFKKILKTFLNYFSNLHQLIFKFKFI